MAHITKMPTNHGATEGVSADFSMLNDSGISTTIASFRACAVASWCPKLLVPLLARFDAVPIGPAHPSLSIAASNVQIESGGEFSFRVTLWAEDRDALARRRLWLRVVHSYSRPGADWVRLLSSVKTP